MAQRGEKMKLEYTAALVTSWAAPLYADGPTAAFIAQLDLSQATGAARALSRRVPLVRRSNLRPKALHKSSHPKRTSDSGRAVSSDDPAAGVSPSRSSFCSPARRVKKVIEVDVAVG